MSASTAQRPDSEEFVSYYGPYVAEVPDGDILATLRERREKTAEFFGGLDESTGNHRYAPEKWTVKEVLGHLIDGERVFAYRALRFARGDRTPLPGFDENLYVAESACGRLPLADLIEEFRFVRSATIALFGGFPDEAWDRRGRANEGEVSVRALAWILAGHEIHHARVVKDRYL